jgi:hypothetical protein
MAVFEQLFDDAAKLLHPYDSRLGLDARLWTSVRAQINMLEHVNPGGQ